MGAALTACGGGGGGSSPPPAPASIVATPGSVTLTANVTESVSPSARVDIVLKNIPASAQYFEGGFSNTGIYDVNFSEFTTAGGALTIYFKAPLSVVPGTYDDSVQLRICEDSQCSKVVPGATVTIPVTYTVTTPTGANAPGFTLATNAVQRSALFTDTQTQQIQIAATLNGLEVFPYTNVAITGTGVDSVDFSPTSLTAGNVYVNLGYAHLLPPGAHHAVIALTVCLDSNCVNPLPGSPFQITVDYTIADTLTVAGTNGYSIKILPIQPADMVWDPSRHLFYAALSSRIGGATGSVATFDPVTQTLGPEVPLGGMPNRIAISDDAQFLYIAMSDPNIIQRLALPALTSDITIDLGTNAAGHELFPLDVQVMPGFPHTVAVSLSDSLGSGGYHAGVAVYDDAVIRPTIAGVIGPPLTGSLVDRLQWDGAATTLYGANVGTSNSLYTMNVDSAGVHLTSEAANAGGGSITFDGGLLYGDSGNIFDPATSSVVRVFNPMDRLFGLVPDSGLQKIFAYGMGGIGGNLQLRSLNLATFAPIATVPIPVNGLGAMRVLRGGSDTIAMVGPYYLVLVNGPFVGP